MDVRDMRDGMRRVDARLEVVERRETRSVSTSRGPANITEVVGQDQTGRITVPLWDEQADEVEVGSVISVQNGYCTSYRGQTQLNVGRYGRLEVATP